MRMPSGILDPAIYLIPLLDVKIQGLEAQCIQFNELALFLFRYFSTSFNSLVPYPDLRKGSSTNK